MTENNYFTLVISEQHWLTEELARPFQSKDNPTIPINPKKLTRPSE